MTGFFTKQETKSAEFSGGKLKTCYSCGLYKNCITPKILPCGDYKKQILNIGEMPDEISDNAGTPFQGKTGRLLQRTYKNLGIDLFEDCINTYAVNCRPIIEKDKTRIPTIKEIECCKRRLYSLIKEYKPKLIMVLGNVSLQSLLMDRWMGSVNTINEWRGFTIPDQEFKTWICPVFSPEFVNTVKDETTAQLIWERDLRVAFSKLTEDFPVYVEPKITYLEDISKLDKIIKNNQIISFDYETTGIKPHAKGHKIVCCSIAMNENEVYVFEIPKDKEKQIHLIKILKNNRILKMAHNCKFEENWSYEILGTHVRGWHWDSMLAAHILDNRPGITGLKFQTYVNFGIVNYNMNISQYLEAKGSNDINKIETLLSNNRDKHELMKYCALDSIHQYRLAIKQMREIECKSLPF
jgi:DNA polymerase